MASLRIVCILQAATLPILAFFHEPSSIPLKTKISLKPDSYFGYSMAYDDKSLLISAPAADRFGKVFEFKLTEAKASENEIISPLYKNIEESEHSKYDWFGAAIKTYGPRSYVICAPRKVRPGIDKSDMEITWGQCWILSSEKKWKPLADITMRDRVQVNFTHGMDAFGWSVDVDDSRNIWIASSVIKKNVIKIYEKGDWTSTRLLPFDTSNMFNFGYSIVNGNFLSDNDSCHAVSTTYGDDRQGKVKFFTSTIWRMKIGNRMKYQTAKLELSPKDDIKELEMESVGSTFGAAMCRVNLGGKRAALLVGAPTFVSDHEGYDRGAVYLYVPNDDEHSTERLIFKRKIKGEKDGGYFGHAIANAGDMDGDKKDEVAIGAPFEEDGRGAVYIYSGARLLLEDGSWSQRIADLAKAFGYTLVPLPDYTGNGLNGLSVSAPWNDTVFVFQPIPFITVIVDASWPNPQVGRKDLSYIDFTIVLNITYPPKPENINTKLNIELQINHPDAQLQHAMDGSVKYMLSLDTKPESYQKPFTILTPSSFNYDVPILYEINVKLDEPGADTQLKEGQVLLSERSVLTKQGADLWLSNCEKEVCSPNLSVVLRPLFSEPYRVGSSEREYVSLDVTNSGDAAYSACAAVRVQGVRLLRPPPGCSYDGDGIMCKPAQRIPNGENWSIQNIELEMDSLLLINAVADKYQQQSETQPAPVFCISSIQNIELEMDSLFSNRKTIRDINIAYDVFYDCNNRKGDVVSANKSVALLYENGINIIGTSIPSEEIEIGTSDKSVARLQHQYTIMNSGFFKWTNVKCDILLQKKNYLQYSKSIMMRRGSSVTECSIDKSKPSMEFFNVNCNIGDLNKNLAIELIIDIEILPNIIGKTLKRESVPVLSQVTVTVLEEESISKKVTSTLVLVTLSVPEWVIIISVLFGILILLVIGCVLYKYNCFERKHKKKLDEEKKSQESIRISDGIATADGNYKSLQDENIIVGVDTSFDHNVANIVDNDVENNAEPINDHNIETALIHN